MMRRAFSSTPNAPPTLRGSTASSGISLLRFSARNGGDRRQRAISHRSFRDVLRARPVACPLLRRRQLDRVMHVTGIGNDAVLRAHLHAQVAIDAPARFDD